MNQFISPHTNRRSDNWGGSTEARIRFVSEILQRVRALAGQEYPILIKLGVEDYIEGGLQLDEGVLTARQLCEMGMDVSRIDLQPPDLARPQTGHREHALHGQVHDLARVLLHLIPESDLLGAVRMAGVAEVVLGPGLVAGQPDLGRVRHHHEIAAVQRRREPPLVLAPQERRGPGGQTAEHLPIGVQMVPLAILQEALFCW